MATLRAVATRFLRPAAIAADGLPFLAPMTASCGDSYFISFRSTASMGPLDLTMPRPTVLDIFRESASSMSEVVRQARQTLGSSQWYKVDPMLLFALGLGGYLFAKDGASEESKEVCMAGSGDQRMLDLEDELKAEKEKNRALRKEIGLLKLGEELEKARISAKRFLGWQLILRESKGGGRGGPQKRTPYEWFILCLEAPRNFKGFLDHQRENSRGWISAIAILSVIAHLTWDDLKKIGRQIMAGEFIAVYDSIRQLLGPKKLPLPLLYCDCGSSGPPVPVCASCGLLVRPTSKEEAGISPKGGKEDGAGSSPKSGKEVCASAFKNGVHFGCVGCHVPSTVSSGTC